MLDLDGVSLNSAIASNNAILDPSNSVLLGHADGIARGAGLERRDDGLLPRTVAIELFAAGLAVSCFAEWEKNDAHPIE